MKTNKVTGIKSIDFKIVAYGNGVVNYNGSVIVSNEGKEVSNHLMPKLRGYTNFSGKIKEENGYKYKKEANDVDFSKTPMYVSQNCIRHHLFKEHAYDSHFATKKNVVDMLISATGLLRGYALPQAGGLKRQSSLLIEDFVDQLGNGNYEQMTRSGSKEKKLNKDGKESSNSLFSKTTFGDTKYVAYGSISVETLQFISCDNKFDFEAVKIANEGEGKDLAKKVELYLKELDQNRNPKATYHSNYVRVNTIYKEGQAGILLNDDAIDILVNEMLYRLENLSFRQAGGYLSTHELTLDYNNSPKMMRIKHDEGSICKEKNCVYANYFYAN